MLPARIQGSALKTVLPCIQGGELNMALDCVKGGTLNIVPACILQAELPFSAPLARDLWRDRVTSVLTVNTSGWYIKYYLGDDAGWGIK